MIIFVHLTHSYYINNLELDVQLNKRIMEEEAKEIRKDRLCYDLNTDDEVIFNTVNNAGFIDKDNLEFVGLEEIDDGEGEYSKWLIKMQPGKKLSEVMDKLPFGILNKTITGLGATTLEIMTQERNSIIVVPTKSLAYNKYKAANNIKGEDYAFYIGSPIKDITTNVNAEKINNYLNCNTSSKKKFLVVADSLPILMNILEKTDCNVYNKYFLMVDEIDTMQSDSIYRSKLENVVDYYFKF